jgi:hemolysin activation/secretion protein
VGGRKVWGTYPVHEAAFIGGPDTVRGLSMQRYAGDASLYGGAELRLRLAGYHLLVPQDVGIFGLVDRGRVFFEGESSDQWHTGAGGGIWLSFLRRENTVSLAAAHSEGHTRLYVTAGFAF